MMITVLVLDRWYLSFISIQKIWFDTRAHTHKHTHKKIIFTSDDSTFLKNSFSFEGSFKSHLTIC